MARLEILTESKKTKEEQLNDLGRLYHSYELFGVKNTANTFFSTNQKCKEPTIVSYMLYALSKLKVNVSSEAEFMELFCADGYYAMLSVHLGYSRSYGLDNGKAKHFGNAEKIKKVLEVENCFFVRQDVNDLTVQRQYDVVANIGGLYHLGNPEEVLDKSYALARNFLIVQNVVSMESNAEDYFVSPAPNWDWGSRYSRESFDKLICSKNWNVIDSHFNELESNEALSDRGSVYYLIAKED
ncbi:MAG TPA: hypothetical protein DCR51_05895 [Idiomarina loihiensis]|nr:hypothetical protein [Idiomarina loihiensis]